MRPHTAVAPMQALYNVLILPSLQRASRQVHTVTRLNTEACRPATIGRLTVPSTKRHFHSTPCTQAKTRPPVPRSQLWNKEIPARRITIVNEKNELSAPRFLREVLRSFDDKTHRLICLTSVPAERNYGDEEWIPICKIVDKKEEYRAEKIKKERQRESKKGSIDSLKTLELNWAIDANDLGHRMSRVAEFLAEGRRVEIVLAKKKRGRIASVEECEEVLNRIKATVEGVKGAKELKAMEGKLGGLATLFLEGPKPA